MARTIPIVGAGELSRTQTGENRPRAWRLVTRFGVLFLAAGLIDIGFALVPLNFSNAALRFTTAASLLGGWPILAVGLVAMLVGGLFEGRPIVVRLAVLLHGVFLALLVIAVVILMVDRGAALAAAQQAARAVNVGFLRALATALCFAMVHVVALRGGFSDSGVASRQQ